MDIAERNVATTIDSAFRLAHNDILHCEVNHAGRKFTANYSLPPGLWETADDELRESLKTHLRAEIAAQMVGELLKMATYTIIPAAKVRPE
jgi:hypothetical protein